MPTARYDLATDAEMLWLSQRLAVQEDPHDRALALTCLLDLARAAPAPVARRAARILADSFGIDAEESHRPVPVTGG